MLLCLLNELLLILIIYVKLPTYLVMVIPDPQQQCFPLLNSFLLTSLFLTHFWGNLVQLHVPLSPDYRQTQLEILHTAFHRNRAIVGFDGVYSCKLPLDMHLFFQHTFWNNWCAKNNKIWERTGSFMGIMYLLTWASQLQKWHMVVVRVWVTVVLVASVVAPWHCVWTRNWIVCG